MDRLNRYYSEGTGDISTKLQTEQTFIGPHFFNEYQVFYEIKMNYIKLNILNVLVFCDNNPAEQTEVFAVVMSC